MKLNDLKDKTVVILGFGREGQDAFYALRKLFPKKKLGVADQRNTSDFSFNFSKFKNAEFHLGKNYLNALKNYDVVIKSPGIPFKILPKNILKKTTTQTEIFFDSWQGKIIGITGTKGKSTTSSMIYEVLKAGGFKAEIVGNIGKPVLSFLHKHPETVFVYELSSFQLSNLKKSPHIAVFLNIYPEHLDYYKNIKEYIKAKSNITIHQKKSDYLVYNSQNAQVKKIAEKSKAKKIIIKGKYYQLDIEAAKKVGEIFNISSEKINKAIENFKFLPHRLEYIGEFKEIKFYNDSLATMPQATIEALDYLGDNIQTLILGGYDRGLDFKKLSKAIAKSKVKTLILFSPTGRRIMDALKKEKNKFAYFNANSMEEAVRLSYKYTDKGKICLLSPASPSFGLFNDYADRGDQFKKFVHNLKNATINK